MMDELLEGTRFSRIKENLALVMLIVSVFIIGYTTSMYLEGRSEKSFISSEVLSSGNCENDDLSITAECLRLQMEEFFKFNLTNINLFRNNPDKSIWKEKIDWEVIKKEGGVCWHYARWYYDKAKELGLSATLPIIKLNENLTHMNVIIADSDEYCVLDQIEQPNCYKVSLEELNEQ